MQRYKNLGGDSGVSFYEIDTDCIKVQFSDGAIYLYTNNSAGVHNINEMKHLASIGRGLNSFINKHVRKKYASQLR